MSCRATNLSSSFESTDLFEIGRYDVTSAGSKSAFFSSGVKNASLNKDGTTPGCNEYHDFGLYTIVVIFYSSFSSLSIHLIQC